MAEFKHDPTADICSTHKLATISLVASRLVQRFGPPSKCDGYKVSGSYCFSDISGRVYTLYDWKATSLYNDGVEEGQEPDAPTPEKFWANDNPDTFTIGGRDGSEVGAFKAWLVKETA